MTRADIVSLAITLHFKHQFCVARRLDCNLLEAVTVALSAEAADVVSDDSPIYIVHYVVCLYSSSSLWCFKSEGHCHFSLRIGS
jgi:site-specific recombinase